jgi:agmatinase
MITVKVPSEQGSLQKNIGCALAPDFLVSKLGLEAQAVDVVSTDIEETDRRIYAKAKELFNSGELPLFIGGDHSITYPIFSAFSEKFGPKNVSLIVFDAHLDACQSFKPVSHEDMNRVLIEEKKLLPQNLLISDGRAIYPQEVDFLEKYDIIRTKSLEGVRDFVGRAKNVYLSIDIDAFDPEVAPGTGYLEKDGLSWEDFEKLAGALLESGKVRGADFVEFNPKKDPDRKTFELSQRILKKIIPHLQRT